MDIAIEFPTSPGATHGLWPSAVAVTNRSHPPTGHNHQAALAYYRANQDAYAILWMDAPHNAVYRVMPPNFDGTFAPDFRVTERGEHELVGLWAIPNQPPNPGNDDDNGDGGGPVPVGPGPLVGHPSSGR